MRRTLTRQGDDASLLLEHTLLELINATPDTPFDITTDGTSLILTPVRQETSRADALRDAIERIGNRYRNTFEELAK